MIIDERMVTYINSLDTGHTPFLENLERTAKQTKVPIIRREMQSFLKVFLKMKQPKRILEVGTAVGFSAVFMAQYGDRITLIPGDAAEVLKTLDGPYDFIFMDAAKGQYIHFLPEVLRVLDKNGVLITDNVLQDGDVIESRFAVERRNRTIHKRMREQHEKTGITGSSQQSGSIKSSSDLRRRCRIYRRRSLRTPREGEELFDGRYERRCGVCA